MIRLSKNWKTAIMLAGIVTVAAAVRWLPYNSCFAGNRIYFFGTDSYYHLRRVIQTLSDFWHAPATDYYLGYPQGTSNMLAPIMYVVSGAIIRVATLFEPLSQHLVETVCAALPTIWGALSCVLAYFIAGQIAGNFAGLIAAFCLAFIPEFMFQTLVGCFDNNGLEPLLAALFFLSMAATLSGNDAAEGSGRKHFIVAASVGWLVLFTWRGSIMFLSLAGFFGLCLFMIGCYYRKGQAGALTATGASLALCGILLVPWVMAGAWGAQPTFQFNAISWLHVALTGGGGALLLALGRLPAEFYRSRCAALAVRLIPLALMAGAMAVLFVSGKRGADVSLYNYLISNRNPWGIQELEPLFRRDGDFSLLNPASYLSWGVWIFPFAWVQIARHELKDGQVRPRVILILIWSMGFVVLAVARVRFAPLAALSIAVVIGTAAAGWRTYLAGRGCGSITRAGAVVLALVCLLLTPAWGVVGRLGQFTYKYPVTDDLFAALEWLRGNTPATAGLTPPWQKPEYGILAQWDFGHWIPYIAQRPAVATPMVNETYGIAPLARFFLAEDNGVAEQVLQANSIRYVLVTNTLRSLATYADLTGIEARLYVQQEKGASGEISDTPKPAWLRLVSTRLLINDGMPFPRYGVDAPPPSHLRLVYESKGILDMRGFDHDVSSVKVFEFVPGARLAGRTTPKGPVVVRMPVVTNMGRRFYWESTATAGANGTYELIVPYATEFGESVHGEGACSVSTGSRTVQVAVPRGAIMSGDIITVQ